ncbi:YesL family protein [Bifidobacterium felsineum]|uniref:Beta-carotene 15,15'-monooxygenase n=1 Tax=Bifidobacterium felsineum TaxID=2045440 RepID=A0A2M9HIT0_9BIFI|nr:DUF624 domain-containing protein [Bifidobacterium felsineum]MBT1165117.1 YesL family protein [Bifidobacterium felsineum]PJM76716.1 hypothetical protein CSQ86_08385 [Bifidobacterium felsineum]
MKFNTNAPFWRFMDTLVHFTALNLLYLLTMIPVITIGPARAALYSTLFAYDENDDISLTREYLRRFKREFKHGLISGIIIMVLAAAIIFGLAFWAAWNTNASYIPLIVLIMAAVIVTLTAEYLFPMQARFENPLGTQWKLAAMFPWRAFPCTLALLGIDVVLLAVAYFIPFIRVLVLIFGVAWGAYAKSLVFLWGFKRYGGMGPVERPTYINAHD